MYLFLDLETTGLDRTKCRIIEVACILTDNHLKPVDEHFRRVIYQNPYVGWEEVALKMHKKNGLYNIVKQGHDERVVVNDLLGWLDGLWDKKPINLAGSSVHFDHAYIDDHWPELSHFFSHRHLDVSSLRLAGDVLGLPQFKLEPAHRAMEDVEQSIREAAHYMSFMKKNGIDPVEHEKALSKAKNAERWEEGFRSIATIVKGAGARFEIPEIVENIRAIAHSVKGPDQ